MTADQPAVDPALRLILTKRCRTWALSIGGFGRMESVLENDSYRIRTEDASKKDAKNALD